MQRKPKQRWTKEQDLELIKAVYAGLTGEAITELLGISYHAINCRLFNLGLGIRETRKAKRAKMTAEQYLDTSPLYLDTSPLYQKPVQAVLTADELFMEDVDALIGHLTELVIRAERVRDFLCDRRGKKAA